MSSNFLIGNFLVGDNLTPYIIAEIGVNHEGNVELAKRLIDEAASSGANAAKFQTYKAGKIASKNSPAYWDLSKEPVDSQYKLFQKYDMFGPEEYQELAGHCASVGIDFMSTPFDLEAVEFLSPLVPAFKIASADITNVPLIRKCAATKKPLLMSTGASTFPEIEHALGVARSAGAKDICLLHCVLNYPTPVDSAQIGVICSLKKAFPEVAIGYSDHVVPDSTISSLEAAMLLGACVLEKHFTHDKSLPGNDHYHAMNGDDLRAFIEKAIRYRELIGDGSKNLLKETAARRNARRSIVSAVRIKAGEQLSENNLIAKRPGHGISPLHWDDLIGLEAACDIEEDVVIEWRMLK